jgi:hypothetical protein
MSFCRSDSSRTVVFDTLSQQWGLLRQNCAIYRYQIAFLFLSSVLLGMMILPVDPLEVRFMLLTYGEVLLPQIAGWIATGILLSDPCRELLLSSGRAIWKTMIERLILVFSATLVAWGLLLLLTCCVVKSNEALQAAGLRMFLGGAISCLCFISIGAVLSLWLHHRIAGGVILMALWALLLLFKQSMLASDLGQVLYPFLTLDMPDSAFWWINRLTLLVFSLLLIYGAARLTRQEEALLPHGEIEEIG